MSASPYLEFSDSQQPALQLLRRLGYTYLSPEEALAQGEDRPAA